MFQNASSLQPLGQLKPNCTGIIIWRSSKKFIFMPIRNPRWLQPEVIVLTQDHMGKYRTILFSEAIAPIKPKLCVNHWKVLYKLRVFYVDRNFKMTTTAGHSSYIGSIGSFYSHVNDTGSWEPLVCFVFTTMFCKGFMFYLWYIVLFTHTIFISNDV